MNTVIKRMTHGSLFSGIGGFDLAAEWAGWENKFHCEWNEFGQKVLKYYWPNATSYGDITKTDFTIWRGKIDVLTGGFPCQPYSMAGKRLGKEDERHLWPEMLRVIREVQPRYVVGENVPGLINWNGGMVFEEVQSNLEAAGYEVIPFILPAAGVNAPHRRERVWFVAHHADARAEDLRQQREDEVYGFGLTPNTESKQSERVGFEQRKVSESQQGEFRGDRCEMDNNRNASYARCSEWENRVHGKEQARQATKLGNSYTKFGRFVDFPTVEPTIRRGNDGLPSQLDGITFSKWRNESIKAYGNAIVPQVVYQIFKAINDYEQSY